MDNEPEDLERKEAPQRLLDRPRDEAEALDEIFGGTDDLDHAPGPPIEAAPVPAPALPVPRLRAAGAVIVAVAAHLYLHLGPLFSQAGWTLSSFRDYYPDDQKSYLAIATNWAHGFRADTEPFTRTGTSPYPDLYYRTMGWLADLVGANPVVVWNLLGAAVQAMLVAGLATATILVTRRWWAGLAAPLPFVMGTLAVATQGTWMTELGSHAVLWGPFGVLFTANGEAAALCLAGLAILALVVVASGAVRSVRTRWVLVIAAAAAVGVLADIQTYTFLTTIMLIACATAAVGVARSPWRVVWVPVTAALVVAVFLLGPAVSSVSPLAALAFGLVPAVPGIVLVAGRHGWPGFLLAVFVAGAFAAPQLLATVVGVASGDEFLTYRAVSSANLGVPAGDGARAAVVLVVALALVVLVGALRRSWFATGAPLGASLAWYLGATNDVWGANQEPYRFWLDMMLLISVGLLPLLVDAFVVVLRTVLRVPGAEGELRLESGGRPRTEVLVGALTVVVVLFSVSTADFADFRRDIARQEPITFFDDRSAVLAEVASEADGGVVLPDPCIDPFVLKIAWGGPTAYYNLGLAWPENPAHYRAVLDARLDDRLDLDEASKAGIGYVVADSDCARGGWASDLDAAGATQVTERSYGADGAYVLWRLP
ncbi:hypothetical protein L1785_00410 [Antribacter sp. KLBMP9083]|uniref:Uncharacterized protein n=1 Tax=Antribacter soli TaxID=2910976 RepID=A0AA41U4X9_9MICO|nr:hypothetical protein [Antribacter soli]MCF4119443.1 hypothetical protein [Antribacter soli]